MPPVRACRGQQQLVPARVGAVQGLYGGYRDCLVVHGKEKAAVRFHSTFSAQRSMTVATRGTDRPEYAPLLVVRRCLSQGSPHLLSEHDGCCATCTYGHRGGYNKEVFYCGNVRYSQR